MKYNTRIKNDCYKDWIPMFIAWLWVIVILGLVPFVSGVRFEGLVDTLYYVSVLLIIILIVSVITWNICSRRAFSYLLDHNKVVIYQFYRTIEFNYDDIDKVEVTLTRNKPYGRNQSSDYLKFDSLYVRIYQGNKNVLLFFYEHDETYKNLYKRVVSKVGKGNIKVTNKRKPRRNS